jgi:hypothetical protein
MHTHMRTPLLVHMSTHIRQLSCIYIHTPHIVNFSTYTHHLSCTYLHTHNERQPGTPASTSPPRRGRPDLPRMVDLPLGESQTNIDRNHEISLLFLIISYYKTPNVANAIAIIAIRYYWYYSYIIYTYMHISYFCIALE